MNNKDTIDNEGFIYKLINHVQEFGYWVDCKIYYSNKCWSSYEIDYFGEAATLIEKRGDVYVYSIQNGLENNSIIIQLLCRMGGLMYPDLYEPRLSELSCMAQRYMREHESNYYGKNKEWADGKVALLALEEFLFMYNKKIVDRTTNEGTDSIITIADGIDNNARRSLKQEEIYILTIEDYERTEIYGAFTDKEKLLEKYLYLLEHNCDASDCPKDLGLCIYAPKINVVYIESYYEFIGGLEWMGTNIPKISPVDIWGKEVEKKIEASMQIANAKREKEKALN